MLAVILLALVSTIFLLISGALCVKRDCGFSGFVVGLWGVMFLFLSLAIMNRDALEKRSRGHPTQFSDTTWTRVTIVSVNPVRVWLVDFPEATERAILYEVSSAAFSRNPVGDLISGTDRDLRVVRSPEGFQRIEVK